MTSYRLPALAAVVFASAIACGADNPDVAAKVGAHLRAGFELELAGIQGVVEYRGQGLMIGIELDRPCADLTKQACEAGLLISVTAERVVRLLPPLIMTTAEADEVVAILAPLIRKHLSS